MCDLMSSNQSSAYQSNTINPTNTNANANSNNNTISLNITNPKSGKLLADYKQIILELRAQNFDVIRFATYRTASKLRFIQKKLNLHLIDLWNVIETFRDNNLHTLDLLYELEYSKLEMCVQNMYLQLNKRLAFNQHINVETQTQLLLAWLLNLYDKNRLSRIKVFSIKIALTTMCAGKLVDKLKYIFNQISDQSKNTIILSKFELYLKDLLILPKSVFEEPSFGYNENISKTCFDLSGPIRLEDFLSVALSDVGPPCFIWLNIFHRFTIVQNITHPVKCSACERTNFNGFRYKCQKCRKYQLCQDCFWRGRISHSHQLTHQMKEYTSYKSAAKQISNSLKRSFFCKPNKSTQGHKQQQTTLQKLPTSPQFSKLTHQQCSLESAKINFSNTNTMINQTNILNNNNSSDYNLLYRNKEKSPLEASKLQAQTLNNINSNLAYTLPATTSLPINNSDIYSNLAKSSPKAKKVFQQLSISSNIEENYYHDDPNNKLIQQPLDLHHIVPTIETEQPTAINQFQPIKPSNYSNTLSMTRSKINNDNSNYASSNLLASFLLTKNNIPNIPLPSSSSITNLINDEHNLIANYCSRLADFYVKNPHLSSSPTFNTPSPSTAQTTSLSNKTNANNLPKSSTSSKLKTNLKSKTNYPSSSFSNHNNTNTNNIDMNSQSMAPISTNINNFNNMANRTASLSRQLWSSNKTKTNYMNNNNSNTISTTTNSKNNENNVFENNLQASILENINANNSKSTSYAIRSLSESNFRTNDIGSTKDLSNIDDRLLREKREIVAKLEKQNREILKEIKRLRLKQISNRSLDLTEQQQQPEQQIVPQKIYSNEQHLSLKNQQMLKMSSKDPTPSSATLSRKILASSGISCGANLVDPCTLNDQYQSSQKMSSSGYLKSSLKQTASTIVNPEIIAELQTLKQRKGQLENRMQMLENSRDELIGRLTQLDTLIGCQPLKQQQDQMQRIVSSTSLKTSPSTSPRGISSKFANISAQNTNQQQQQSLTNINIAMPNMGMQQLIDNQTKQISPLQTSFVPIVSASMAMQMPLIQPQLQNQTQQKHHHHHQQQQQQQNQHQHRTGIITNLNSTQQLSSHVQPRSWSTPSTPALYELHPTRLANNQQIMQQNTLQPQQQQQQQQQLLNKHQVASSLAPSASSLLSLTASSISNTSASASGNLLTDHNRLLRNDLLIAADSVTNAMQNLVKELNSENESFNSNTSDDEEENLNNDLNSYSGKLLNGSSIPHNRYTYSLSASATPVTLRKNIYQTNPLNNTQNQQQILLNRNAVNLDDYNLENLKHLSSQITNGFSNNNNNNDSNFDNLDLNTNKNEYMNYCDDECIPDNDDDEIDQENMLYENYLIAESFIDDLNPSSSSNNNNLNSINNQLQNIQFHHQQQSVENQLSNLVDNSEQVASWRRELEQILIEDSNNNDQNGLEQINEIKSK